jgi:hypothetical protein
MERRRAESTLGYLSDVLTSRGGVHAAGSTALLLPLLAGCGLTSAPGGLAAPAARTSEAARAAP